MIISRFTSLIFMVITFSMHHQKTLVNKIDRMYAVERSNQKSESSVDGRRIGESFINYYYYQYTTS